MAIRADILRDAGWFRKEQKVVTITVLDASNNAVNLATTNVSWHLLKEANSATRYLHKTLGSNLVVGGTNNNIVTITVVNADYNTVPVGIHYHELWNDDQPLLLSYGDVHIRPTRGPVA